MKRRFLPRYVTAFIDRHGKERLRFRRKGYAPHYFKAELGAEAFRVEYRACLDGSIAPSVEAGAERAIPGTFDDLIARYYRSTKWLNPRRSEATRAYDRRMIETFRAEHGKRVVRDMKYNHVEIILARKADTPTAANKLRKQMRRLLAFAVQIEMRPDNPAEHVDRIEVKSTGYHTWTEDEIAQYQAHHPLGTKPRLALELMLWTGNRKSDAIRTGRQHIRNGRITITQQKTGKQMTIPVAPQLVEAIVAMPPGSTGDLCLLVTKDGLPYTPNGFGNRMRDWCNEAGLPQCSSHGLRKAISRRMADIGQGNPSIKSITGHLTDGEVARYTRDADQSRMADDAMRALVAWERSNRRISKKSNLS